MPPLQLKNWLFRTQQEGRHTWNLPFFTQFIFGKVPKDPPIAPLKAKPKWGYALRHASTKPSSPWKTIQWLSGTWRIPEIYQPHASRNLKIAARITLSLAMKLTYFQFQQGMQFLALPTTRQGRSRVFVWHRLLTGKP